MAAAPDRANATRGDARRDNEIAVSAATIWEIAIKRAIGKLRFDRPIVAAVLTLGFEILPVAGAHAEHAGSLPPHHSDPFDRLIIAQAQLEGMMLGRRIGVCGLRTRRSALADPAGDWRQVYDAGDGLTWKAPRSFLVRNRLANCTSSPASRMERLDGKEVAAAVHCDENIVLTASFGAAGRRS